MRLEVQRFKVNTCSITWNTSSMGFPTQVQVILSIIKGELKTFGHLLHIRSYQNVQYCYHSSFPISFFLIMFNEIYGSYDNALKYYDGFLRIHFLADVVRLIRVINLHGWIKLIIKSCSSIPIRKARKSGQRVVHSPSEDFWTTQISEFHRLYFGEGCVLLAIWKLLQTLRIVLCFSWNVCKCNGTNSRLRLRCLSLQFKCLDIVPAGTEQLLILFF